MPIAPDLAEGMPLAAAAASGYLLGSLPFGYLVARSRGVNIFEVGSRSPGATNVGRVLGRGAGNTVFVLDTLKGAFAAGLPLLSVLYFIRANAPSPGNADTPLFASLLTAAHLASGMGYIGLGFALIGHSFSCFTRFRGGKGVATAAGGLLVLMPYVALIAAALWVAIFYATRYVSLASILAALSLPILALIFAPGKTALAVSVMVALFVVIRHRANVGRLLSGTEKKFERGRPGEPPQGANP